jgi:hypothetical protein
MPRYALARHVFVCMQGEHVVFLDVRNDRYFALESGKTAGLGEWVPGWPVLARGPEASANENSVRGDTTIPGESNGDTVAPVLSLLLEKGILTPASADGKEATPVVAHRALKDLAIDSMEEAPALGPAIVFRFLKAATVAALILKMRSFEYAVGRVRERNARSRDSAAGSAQEVDVSRIHQLVAVFATLRPFFFTAKDQCLFDALALSEFLAGFGIHPQWIFAVQARPFAAHCWLQQGDIVLNDTVEHVRRYAPIMVV